MTATSMARCRVQKFLQMLIHAQHGMQSSSLTGDHALILALQYPRRSFVDVQGCGAHPCSEVWDNKDVSYL